LYAVVFLSLIENATAREKVRESRFGTRQRHLRGGGNDQQPSPVTPDLALMPWCLWRRHCLNAPKWHQVQMIVFKLSRTWNKRWC